MSARAWIVIAGVTGALGVATGAFGAHGMPSWLEKSGLAPDEVARRMETLEIGVRYQMYHALALLGVGLLAQRGGGRGLLFAGAAFLLGTALFSGLLYVLAVTGIKTVGVIVPVGGVLLIAGWVCLVWAARDVDVSGPKRS
jgi:uncharacterized membrane protein YgdD (TMEM256/DUF423 family)